MDGSVMNSGPESELTRSLELVQQAQGGDLDALNRLFERYYERVRRIVRIRLGRRVRGHLDSDDVLQDTFIAAVQNFNRFEVREPASLIHWFSRIAEHRIMAASEHQSRQKRDPGRERALRFVQDSQRSGELNLEPAASVTAPLSALIHDENLEQLEECLGELKEEWREVVLLREYAGASWPTIQGILGVSSPDAARMLYSRAITELTLQLRKRNPP